MVCTHVAEQLLFSMFPTILTFDVDLVLGSFFTFEAIICNFLVPGSDLKIDLGPTDLNADLGPTHGFFTSDFSFSKQIVDSKS